jgi:radical SAM protein with 4Fe4S-binding SPASM domain
MSLENFERAINEVKSYTKEIACHVVGDPLTLSNLSDYLDIIYKHNLKALITTSGYFMKKHSFNTLFHPAIKQVNISLNAYNKNDTAITFKQYIEPILEFTHAKIEQNIDMFINLRVWNLDSILSEREFNENLFALLESEFNTKIELDLIDIKKQKSIRLANKVLVHFDNYFEWPKLNNKTYGHGTCQGLSSHIGILANGDVIPCCLDSEAVMKLGNINKTSLDTILKAKRAQNMINNFKINKCSEELCLKCSYKERFN